MRVTRHHSCRVSPFGHPRINARLTAPRGLSQPPTSFIGSQCQGIHHAPLNTYNTKNQFEKRNCTSTHKPTPDSRRRPTQICVLDARNHYPQIKHHTPPPKQGNNTPIPPNGDTTRNPGHGPVVSKPNSVFSGHPTPPPPKQQRHKMFIVRRAPDPHPLQAEAIQRIDQITEPPHDVGGPDSRGAP